MHYSIRTEEVYIYWARAFIRFHGLRHPRDMGRDEVVAFLTYPATQRQVAPSTHKQARAALLFLYKQVLEIDWPWMTELARPAGTRRIPAVLTQQEVVAVLARLDGEVGLLARLLYGNGMRLMEGVRLRVKDVEFSRGVIIVRDGKGGKDRVVMLRQSLVERSPDGPGDSAELPSAPPSGAAVAPAAADAVVAKGDERPVMQGPRLGTFFDTSGQGSLA